jgi:hypothetical protein
MRIAVQTLKQRRGQFGSDREITHNL